MVMPCSRSAFRPSVKSEKSIGPALRCLDAFSTETIWSSYTDFESWSSLPISVLFPSSTLPAVQMRRSPPSAPCTAISEVSFPLFEFHRPVLIVVDDPQQAFGLLRLDQLFDDLRDGVC